MNKMRLLTVGILRLLNGIIIIISINNIIAETLKVPIYRNLVNKYKYIMFVLSTQFNSFKNLFKLLYYLYINNKNKN